MQGSTLRKDTLVCGLAGIALFSLCLVVLPQKALADVAMVQTGQILPTGGNACAKLSISGVQPYIYDGALNSFDVVVQDSSYVSVVGEVGNTAIPFYFMTRSGAANGGLRIHVDIPTSPINGSLPVSITLLSAPAGQPVCASIVSFNVMANGEVVPALPIPQTSANQPSSENSGGASAGTPANTEVTTNSGNTSTTPATGSTSTGTESGVVVASVVGNTFSSTLANVCAGNGSYRLWLILLVLYLIIVAAVIFSQPSLVNRSTQGAVAAILVPLIVLIALWYFSPACRGASLLPLVACFIGIAGLFIAFGEQKNTIVLALPEKL